MSDKKDEKNNKKQRNKYAVWGLGLSILSIFGIGLAGLVGMTLGFLGLNEIKHTNEEGKEIAIAAIVIGFIWSFGVFVLKALVRAGY